MSTNKHFTRTTIELRKNEAGKVYLGVSCKNNNGKVAFYDIRGNEVISPIDGEALHFSYLNPEVMFIGYEKDGLAGAFDLNGEKLVSPCATSYVVLFKNKIKMVNEKN